MIIPNSNLTFFDFIVIVLFLLLFIQLFYTACLRDLWTSDVRLRELNKMSTFFDYYQTLSSQVLHWNQVYLHWNVHATPSKCGHWVWIDCSVKHGRYRKLSHYIRWFLRSFLSSSPIWIYDGWIGLVNTCDAVTKEKGSTNAMDNLDQQSALPDWWWFAGCFFWACFC